MTFDSLLALELLQQNNYSSLVIVSAVIYDYSLTFSREIEYVWHRSWTWVSTLFLLVRYFGLCWAILGGLGVCTWAVVLCTIDVRHEHSKGTVYFVSASWVAAIYLAAANLVMALRVYAMWNRSKKIFLILLLIYTPQVATSFVLTGIYYNPRTYLSVSTIQITGFSTCSITISNVPAQLHLYNGITRSILGIMLLVLPVIQASKRSFEMYRATKQWQINQCIQQLVRDGIFYFILNTLYNITVGLNTGPAINSTAMLALDTVSYIALCPMMPRFIINVRELYDTNLCRRCSNTGSTFRVFPHPTSRGNPSRPASIFMDIGPGQGLVTEGTANESEDGIQLAGAFENGRVRLERRLSAGVDGASIGRAVTDGNLNG